MARKPRSYVRKIKGWRSDIAFPNKNSHLPGCHQCLKRRINCDRAEPSCAKCVSRGIACSGLGFNYRFRNGLPSKLREGEQANSRDHEASSPQNTSVQISSAGLWNQFNEECILDDVSCDESQFSLDWDNFSSPPSSPGTALTAALPYTSTWNDFLLTYCELYTHNSRYTT
jgi:Fungal Zn(2)-Cys(6) binuclear cluster domain